MKNLILIFLFLLFFLNINAQTYSGKIYGGDNNDSGNSIIQTENNNFLIVGTTKQYIYNSDNVYLLKIDNTGQFIFEKNYGEQYHDRAMCISKQTDGNFLICGSSWGGFGTSNGRENPFVLKINNNGKIIWQKSYHYYHRDQAYSVKELSDGNILLIGYTKSFTNKEESLGDIYLLKINSKGEKIWEKSYHSSGNDYGFDFVELPNNDLILLCNSGGFYNQVQADYTCSHDADILLIKTDENGNELSRTKWGLSQHDFAKQIIPSPDGEGFFIVGSTQSYGNGSFDILLLKVDENLNEIWHKTYGGSNFDYGMSIDITKDNNYLYICGSTYSEETNSPDIFVLKTDLDGTEIWTHSIDNFQADYGNSIKAIENGGCILVGTSGSYSNNNNVFVQKFDKNGKIEFYSTIEEIISSKLYPNPANKNQEINIEIYPQEKQNNYQVNLFDSKGRFIKKGNINNSKWTFSVANAGIYFYQISYLSKVVLTGKFVVY